MLSKCAMFRYERALIYDERLAVGSPSDSDPQAILRGTNDGGWTTVWKEEKPQTVSPQKSPLKRNDPILLNGREPMEQARPMSLLTRTSESIEQSLESLNKLMQHCKRLCFSTNPVNAEEENLILEGIFVWLRIFHLYGFDFHRHCMYTLANQVDKTFRLIEVYGDWMKYFKFKNAAFFSAWLDQELPQMPNFPNGESTKTVTDCTGVKTLHLVTTIFGSPKHLFGGSFYRFLTFIMKEEEMRSSFTLSILQSKKGMPRPTDKMVEEAVEKSVKTMTTVKPQIEWRYCEVGSSTKKNFVWYKATICEKDPSREFLSWKTVGRDFMQAKLQAFTMSLFKNFDMSLNELSSFILPSASSNYNRTRAKFGTYGELEQHALKWFEGMDKPTFLLKMTKLRGYMSDYYGQEGCFDREVALLDNDADWLCRNCVGIEVNYDLFLQRWRGFYWSCVCFAIENEREALCEAVGLKEALKVRVISKGPPVTYFVLKPIQQAMWRHLQKFWNFELTGRPVTEELINKRFGRMSPETRFHSGDYQGATDELHSWCSETVGNTLFACWERNLGYQIGPLHELFIRALTKHTYVVKGQPSKNDFTGVASSNKMEQKRGQLMGSIVSFIVLCICNGALMTTAYDFVHKQPEGERKRSSIVDYPIEINGDDCATAYTSPDFPRCWEALGAIMGFTKSVGKTYDSGHFLSINSHFYRLDYFSRFVEVRYVNLGLLNGMKRSEVTGSEKTGHDLGVNHRELIESSPTYIAQAVHRMFLYQHCEKLREFPGPWFLPTHFGGLGLKQMKVWETRDLVYVSVVKLLIANGDLPPVPPKTKEWIHYDLFMKVVRENFPLFDRYNYSSYDGEETYGECFKALILSEWVRNGVRALRCNAVPDNVLFYSKMVRYCHLANAVLNDRVFAGLKPSRSDEIEAEPKRVSVPIFSSVCNL